MKDMKNVAIAISTLNAAQEKIDELENELFQSKAEVERLKAENKRLKERKKTDAVAILRKRYIDGNLDREISVEIERVIAENERLEAELQYYHDRKKCVECGSDKVVIERGRIATPNDLNYEFMCKWRCAECGTTWFEQYGKRNNPDPPKPSAKGGDDAEANKS